MYQTLRTLVYGIGASTLLISTAVAVFSVFGFLPRSWLEPTMLSLLASAVGWVFFIFALYLDHRFHHGPMPETTSGLRLALGAAAAFAIVSFFEGVV